MNIWGSTSLRRMALPLAVVSLGAALTAGWGQSLASSGGATSSVDSSSPDPEVTAQSVVFVLSPTNDDNFQPFNACGGAPQKRGPVGTENGTWDNVHLSVSQNRCTLAIFSPNSKQGQDLKYSSKPCPVDAFPINNDGSAGSPASSGIQLLDSKKGGHLKECTAPAFLASVEANPALLTPAQDGPAIPFAGAAGVTAVHDYAGSSCKPGGCILYMSLVSSDGELNAPGLCSGAFYLTSPCTIAVVTTSSVAAHPGGATINFSDNKCPTESNLSLPPIGDIGESCTNLPFKPADMSMTLPPGMTPNPELLPVVATPNSPHTFPQHSTEIASQAISYDLAPAGQFTFDPPNACSYDGLKPVNRCTAAIINVPIGFAGGDINYPDHRCVLDESLASSHGNGQGDPCFAQPFSPSKGTVAIHNLPPVTCHAPAPAVSAAGVFPVVACRIFVVLTRDDGDFNGNNPCSTLANATNSIQTACLLMSATTSERHEGDFVSLGSSTPLCVSGAASAATASAPSNTNPFVGKGFDADVHTDCVSAGAFPTNASDQVLFNVHGSAAGSLADLIPDNTGAVAASATGTHGPVVIQIPQDPVLGNV